MINSKCHLDKSFQEILYRKDNWINKGSGWIIESIDGEYINISAYSPLVGSTYIELPSGLNKPVKGLINIKNNDNKCFLWCHIRYLNLLKRQPERITKEGKNIIDDIDYEGIKFLVSKKDYCKIEGKTIFVLMCFFMKID